jgi:hypothetical protein
VAAARQRPATEAQLLQRALSVVLGDEPQPVLNELNSTATTAALLARSGVATRRAVRQLAGLQLPAGSKPHSMDAGAMAELVTTRQQPSPPSALQPDDLSGDEGDQPVLAGLPVVARRHGRAPVVCPAALLRMHGLPAPAAEAAGTADQLRTDGGTAGGADADGSAAPGAHAAAAVARLPELPCGCPPERCFMPALATMVYNCELHWDSGPPSAPISTPAAPPMAPAAAADAAAALGTLLAAGVVETLPPAALSDPEQVACISPIFVVRRDKLVVQPDETAAAAAGDVALLRIAARRRASQVAERVAAYAAARPAAPPLEWFTHANDYQRTPGKSRIVFDLRGLNHHLRALPFTMASAWDVVRQWRKGAWFVTVDIKGGYYHVRMAPGTRKYLAFKFGGNLYRFKRLPMGLSTAPAIFCALSAALGGMLRRAGVNVGVIYIDDIVIIAPSREEAERALAIIRALFNELNVDIQEPKVQGPAQSVTELGLRLVCQPEGDDYVTVPGEALLAVLTDLAVMDALLAAGPQRAMVPLHFLERLVGRLVWAAAVTPVASALMRPLWRLLYRAPPAGAGGMVSMWHLRRDLQAPIRWWLSDPLLSPTRVMRAPIDAVLSGGAAALRTDASDTNFGGYAVAGALNTSATWPSAVVWGTWHSAYHGGTMPSSAWRELYAIVGTLLTFAATLSGKVLLIFTDNDAVVAAINSARSGRDSSDRLAVAFHRACLAMSIQPVALWLAREKLTLPDAISKCTSLPDVHRSLAQATANAARPTPRVVEVPAFQVPASGDGRIRILPPATGAQSHAWPDALTCRADIFL